MSTASSAAEPAGPGLAVEQVNAGYGRVDVLRGCDLNVAPGEAIALVGPNGAGKSTLFKVIAGLVPTRSGRVLLDGKVLRRSRANARARDGVVYVREGRCVFPGLDVAENLELGAIALGYKPRAADYEHVFRLFPVLDAKRRQLAGTLSGGEQRMLGIARGLIARPRFLLLDEPSLGLAPLLVQQLGDACRTLVDEGLSIVLAEQNLGLVERVGGTVHLMTWGKVERRSDAATVRTDEKVAQAVLGAQLSEA
jgi:branched-chain amino acid transport system ATP-binding protein